MRVSRSRSRRRRVGRVTVYQRGRRFWVYYRQGGEVIRRSVGLDRTEAFSLAARVIRETRSKDLSDNVTTSTTEVDADHALVVESVVYPDAGPSNEAQRVLHGARVESSLTQTGVETTYVSNQLNQYERWDRPDRRGDRPGALRVRRGRELGRVVRHRGHELRRGGQFR